MDPDEEFIQFLKKTKENLSSSELKENRMGSESATSSAGLDESTDDLENFLARVRICSVNSLQKKKESKKILLEKDHDSFKPQDKPLQLSNKGALMSTDSSIEVNKNFFNLHDAELQAAHDFMEKRKIYAEQLYNFFNKTVFNNRLTEDMPLIWNGYLQSTAGRTVCRRKNNEYSCRIELSTDVMTSFERLRDTVLHEMCHAACWLVNHSNDHHGPLWHTWASRCNLILPEIQVPVRCHSYKLDYTYTLKCVSCDWVRKRFKMCPKLKRNSCPKCGKATTLTVGH